MLRVIGAKSRSFAIAVTAMLLAFHCYDPFAQSTAVLHPVLRLEKPDYLLGESIRFWVGVVVEGDATIPRDQQKPCSLSITKPDGRTETRPVSWPLDGMIDRGWTGGFGLNAELPGSYSLVLECAGERTVPVELIVHTNEIIQQIEATFRFQKTGNIPIVSSVPVTFSVTNNSPYTIQFPRRGVMMEGISLSVVRREPPFRSDLFYPWEELSQSQISFDRFDWDAATKLPSVTLPPGGHFEQDLFVDHAFKFDQLGTYEVTISTVMSTLVGQKDGDFANLCPVRLIAEAKRVFVVSDGPRVP